MIRNQILCIALLGVLFWSSSANAVVRLTEKSMTIEVMGVPLTEILKMVSQQGKFSVKGLETMGGGNYLVTHSFHNLPIEEGFARLLNGFNYFMLKDSSTMRLKLVHIVSKRDGKQDTDLLAAKTKETGRTNFTQDSALLPRSSPYPPTDEWEAEGPPHEWTELFEEEREELEPPWFPHERFESLEGAEQGIPQKALP